MNIRTKLLLSISLITLLSLAMVLVLIVTRQQITKTVEENEKAEEIVKETFWLNNLLNDYLLYHEDRALEQWDIQHQKIGKLLDSKAYTDPEDQAIYTNILQAHKSAAVIFPRLAEEYNNHASQELQSRLTSQLLIKSQIMVTDSERLAEKSAAKTQKIGKSSRVLLNSMIGVLVLSATLILLLVYKSIVGPITKLQKGTTAVAAGDWNYTITMKSTDEIGQLAHAFNHMTKKISSYIKQQKQIEKEKDDFTAAASHELKTPVTSIKIYGQIVQRELQNAGNMKSAELIHKMNKQLDKLSNLINDLLDVNKTKHGTLHYTMDKFEINHLITEIIQDMQQTTENHRIIQKLDKRKTIYGDPNRIGQVLINLVANAIKYSPDAEKIIVGTSIESNTVTVSVQDFGIGVAKKDQKRIFGQFYRTNSIMQKTYPGLGLGLYISHNIIKRHGGNIWMKSNQDQGSTFYFSLPFVT